MDIATISLLIVIALSVMLFLGVPLAFVSGSIAVTLALTKFGVGGLFIIGSRTAEFLDSFGLVSVPMFILMASFLEQSGVARDLFRAIHVWAGGLRGGLAAITVFVAVILGATTGIIGGEIVLLGMIALPQMLRLGYNRKLAIGTITSGGSLGTMIPPSVVLVFYGITAQVSISHLFLATLVPGLLLAGLYITYILVMCHLRPDYAPPPEAEDQKMPLREKLVLLRGIALPVFIAASVLASIYAGFASITESAALGVIGTMFAAAVRRELSIKMIKTAALQALSTCGMVFWLIFGTNSLIGVYNLMGGITFAREGLAGISANPHMIMLTIVVVLLILGMFLDWIGIMFLTMPIFLPVIIGLGYDPIWFGIVFNVCMQVSYLSPPFGPACFYLKGVAPPDMTLQEIFSAQWPFMGLQVLGLGLIFLFPSLVMWLPKFVYN